MWTGVTRRPRKRTNLHQPLTFNGMHYKKRLVVLTTEWLSWLHGSLLCQRLNVKGTKEVVSLFLLFSLFQNEERGGNNKETCCLGVDTPIVEEEKPVTMVIATKYCVIVVLYIY